MADAKSILIVGASRGLGKGLAELYVKNGWSVLATVRDAKAAPAGAEAAVVDINDADSVSALHRATEGRKFDVIFIVAGIGAVYQPLFETGVDMALEIYRTNALSPMLFADLFVNRLAAQGQLVFMSSTVGSIGKNTVGGLDAYRASKAALNMLAKNFWLRRKAEGVSVTIMHPGWVRTDMGGDRADIDVNTSVAGMVDVVTKRHGADDLAYVDYTGATLPW